ncbi:hypothetical protein NQ315_010094 [Exocentrus adspersus]|uniref:Uncharacterized protein n=1 Tax=Exocentrus adspersus TaxID=1586481 RepID=A0AAV8WCT4_9CUCU|nr:hypothetical protein NQ315_010094 [Exocentrus adspersus]
MVLSERQRIEILILLGSGDKIRSQAEVCALFNAKYPENQISQGQTGRARALNEEKKLDIALELLENPHTSTVSLACNHDAPLTTIRRFLKQEKHHPYKVYLVQELLEHDYDMRLQFCEEIMRPFDDNNGFQRDILFSDEATFYLNGVTNRHKLPLLVIGIHTGHANRIRSIHRKLMDGQVSLTTESWDHSFLKKILLTHATWIF